MKWKKHHKNLASCLIMKKKGNKMCYTVNRLNGDYMRYEDLKSLFDRNNELKFRLYNLDYIAFDVYLKNSSSQDSGDPLQLDKDSSVIIGDGTEGTRLEPTKEIKRWKTTTSN